MASAPAWPQSVAAGFLQTVAKKGVIGCPPNLGGRAPRFRVMPTVQPQSVPITRLKRRNDFLCVAHRGQKWVAPGLVLQSRRRRDTESRSRDGIRIGFTVTKKVGNAVIRNRTRRRLKAAAMDVMAGHGQNLTDYVLIGRAGTLKRPYALLVADLETAMQKLNAYRA